MSTTLPPLVLRFDVDDKGSVKYSRIQKGMGGVNKGMDRQSKQMDSLSKKWGGFHRQLTRFVPLLGTLASALTLRAAIRSTMELASTLDEIGKRAFALSMTTEALSELSFAANLAGIKSEKFEKDIGRLPKFLADADRGLSTATVALDQLGLSVDDFRGLDLDKQLELFADGFQDLHDPIQRTNVLTAAFGRDGLNMVNMLSDGSEGLRSMRQEAERFGASIDVELAQKGALFNDALLRMQTSFKALRRDALSQFLVPASIEMTLMADRISEMRGDGDAFPDIIGGISEGFTGIVDRIVLANMQLELFRKLLEDAGVSGVAAIRVEIMRMWDSFSVEAMKAATEIKHQIREALGSPVSDFEKQLADAAFKAGEAAVDRQARERAAAAELESQARRESIQSLRGQIEEFRKLSAIEAQNRSERRVSIERDLIATGRLNEERQEMLAAAQRALAIQEAQNDSASALLGIERQRLRTVQEINREVGATYGGERETGSALAGGGFIAGLLFPGLFGERRHTGGAVQSYHNGGEVQKFHGGGMALRADEVPAILQTGEYVASREMVSRGAAPAAPAPPQVAILSQEEIENFMRGPRGKQMMRSYIQEMQ